MARDSKVEAKTDVFRQQAPDLLSGAIRGASLEQLAGRIARA